jgi:hypothetical protein
MKQLLKPLTAILAALCLVLTAVAQVTKEQETEIRKMIQLTGMMKMMEQMKDQMLTSLKQGSPAGVPEEFWDKARKKMKVEDLIEQIIPLYAKYYSVEDIKAINAFYESPAGQRLLAQLPQLMQESMKIGQAWGQKAAQEVVAELQAELRKKETANGAAAPEVGK